MLYLRLFHGRKDLAEEMDDWGTDGPVFGPYNHVHTTYGDHVKMGQADGDVHELFVVEDMIYYDGIYYGDWSVFTDDAGSKEAQFSMQPYDNQKAKLPKKESGSMGEKNPPVKIIVYVSGGVCHDVKTNLPDDSWEYSVIDYDSEPDLPVNYMPFGPMQMKPLPSMAVMLKLLDAAAAVVKKWDSGNLAGCVRQMAEILKRN